ncbi:abortive infection family protein [Kribbella speibonae]|uniref:abortive infection family protein n=1 Tax=Kribbella speibonae TaxID=1572660 RepID=UPI0013F47797|nr:abortive infection family protein [Kribbella speibonae]
MTDDPYDRFRVPLPEHIGTAHTEAIDLELQRFSRAIDARDDGQAIGYLKCLIEAIAKVVLDLNGTPAGGSDSFDPTVKQAHDLLAAQPGHELANGTQFGNLATQARKMAVSMSTIRNNYGGGHGRARQPELQAEMLDLAMDGSLLWVRWAIRRLGYFAQGRPETLIRDLVGDPTGQISFYAGDLTSRLQSADLPNIDPRHARSIGLAVGQRAAQHTFNVRIEGVDAAVSDNDLERWPTSYRVGVANGLLFSPDELPTIAVANVQPALQVCSPVIDAPDEIATLLRRVIATRAPGPLPGDPQPNLDLLWFVEQHAGNRPADEQAAWRDLAHHLRGEATVSRA